MDKQKAREYLESIGMIGMKNELQVERLISSMEVQLTMPAYKNGNRFSSRGNDGITQRIAWAIGCNPNLVNRFVFKCMERFKESYDPKEPKYASICTPRTLEVISPLQFLYLITHDFDDKFGK